MFTRNYYKMMAACMNKTDTGNDWTLKDITNTDKSIYTFNGSNYKYTYYLFTFLGRVEGTGNQPTLFLTVSNPSACSSHGFHHICFGDGNAAPTIDDYKLSGNPIETLSTLSKVIESGYDATSNKLTISLTFTLRNDGSEAVTIREVADFSALYATSSSAYVSMLDRTLLAAPVTIPSGGTGVVTYDLNYNFPTA